MLAQNESGGDDNLRLGFQVNGYISQTASSPGGGDVDVYSFSGYAGSTVWFDMDDTASSLDSVVELINSSGGMVALSDNSAAEQANPTLLQGIGKPMQILPTTTPTNAAGPSNALGCARPLHQPRLLQHQPVGRRHAR